jgi:hypothetical protein
MVHSHWQNNIDDPENNQQSNALDAPKILQMALGHWVPNNCFSVRPSHALQDARKKLYSAHDFQSPEALLGSIVF